MIRNIVFDMGMVLMQWNPMNPCLRYAKDPEKANILCDNIFRHEEWGRLIDGGEMSEEDYFVRCSERMPTQELKELCLEMSKDWTQDSLYPTVGMRAVIGLLKAIGYNLYILSNCGRHFHVFEDRIPGINHFDGILISAEERMLKPNREIYERLLEKFNLKAEECIFIDDLQANIDAAKAVGFEGYCFADGDVQRLHAYLCSLKAYRHAPAALRPK